MSKKAPTIRSSAQARLLLYRLLSSKLNFIADEFKRSTPGSWERLLEQFETLIALDFANQHDRTVLQEIFDHIDQSTTRDFKRQLMSIIGTSLHIGPIPTSLLEDFIKEHLQLIKAVRTEHVHKIGHVINRGLREGQLAKDIAKSIGTMTDIKKHRARLIARNAPLQYSGALTKHHQISAGITKYRWQSSRDERVRESHAIRNNKVYSWDAPGPHPRTEVNCRCDAVPVLP